jgi:Predicted transcriptional regulator
MFNGEKTHSILRRKQVETMTGLSRSSIYAKMATGTFPLSIKLDIRATGWVESEIQDWIRDRINTSRGCGGVRNKQ